jgi:outer membrane protein assembly factor BamB
VVGAGAWTVVLSAATGTMLYEHQHSGGQLYGAATIAHGVIYQGDHNGVLTAFGL